MNDLEIVASTTEPAFAVNARGRLLAWNAGAERLFGHRASEVVGRRCWEVLAGRDIFGNDHCQKDCQLRRMAGAGRSVHPYELVFRNALGEPVQARVLMLTSGASASGGGSVIHLVCPLAPGTTEQSIAGWKACANANSRLTSREQEVLGLLADGKGTRRIAEELGLSPATVRNHIQRILHKLRVHSRLEAVALARRVGLIC